MVCKFYTLPPDRLFLNFGCKYVSMQAINLPNKEIRFLSQESPSRNVMKSSLSKQKCEISNLFQQNKRESALGPINELIIFNVRRLALKQLSRSPKLLNSLITCQ